MIAPKVHEQETARIEDLKSYNILDTLPESDYDDLTAIAAEICGTEISLISLIDENRQWFKSSHGLQASETPRELAFCAHAINDPKNNFIIPDARTDERFYDNPLVTGDPNVVFYAGVPLLSDNGLPLGTLCVIDHHPKSLSENQIKSLKALANQVMHILNLRKTTTNLEQVLLDMEEKNRELEHFAHVAAHDLKSPLVGISGMSQLLLEDYRDQMDPKGIKMLQLLESAAVKLGGLIDGLLDYSKSERILKANKSVINLEHLKNEILDLFSFEKALSITLTTALIEVVTNKAALDQILINLVANAIKYNEADRIKIDIGVTDTDTHYQFYVRDNGPGIQLDYQEKIFTIFNVMAQKDRYGKVGNGIGLATVKKIVEKSGGMIKVESELGKGSKFTFTLEK